MKWITLKMHMLPVIFQEIDIVTEQYIGVLNAIRKCEEEGGDTQAHVDEFNDMRESITKRINELETFYEDNIEDIRITSFEKARQRLKKLLMYDVETITKIENSAQNYPLIIANKHQEVDSKSNQENVSNNISQKGSKSKAKGNDSANQQSTIQSKKQTTGMAMTPSQMKPASKDSSAQAYMKPVNRANRDSTESKRPQAKNEANAVDMGEITNCKEIVFKIRLNETEYKLLMKEKTKSKK